MASFSRILALLVAVAVGGGLPGHGWANEAGIAFQQSHDQPTPSWQLRPQSGWQLAAQQRQKAPGPDSVNNPDAPPVTAERLVLAGPVGFSGYLAQAVTATPVLEELQLEVTLRCNVPGLQLAAEVVLPRSLDPATKAPQRMLVIGERYSQAGIWQPLQLTHLPLLTERQARILRMQSGQPIDIRQAYVDHAILVTPGSNDYTVVEVDHLVVRGVPLPASHQRPTEGAAANSPVGTSPSPQNDDLIRHPVTPVEIRRQGNLLTVAEQPFFPRLIEQHQEPLNGWAQLGFSGIVTEAKPTLELLRRAYQQRLWVLCPPPRPDQLASLSPFTPWQAVLAWSLGGKHDAHTIDTLLSLANQTREFDRSLQRPLAIPATSNPRHYSQLADILIHAPTNRNNEFPHSQPPFPRLGCCSWSAIDLAVDTQLQQQLHALTPSPSKVTSSQILWQEPLTVRAATYQAIATGASGLLFQQPGRLTAGEADSQPLQLQLQLLNQELALVEPWLVSGKQVSGATLTNPSRPVTAWRLGQSRLILIPPLPTQLPPASPGSVPASPALTMAGVSETVSAYQLTPSGLLPLVSQRVTGGLRVETSAMTSGGFVLLTDDPRQIAQIKQRTAPQAESTAKTARQLAIDELARAETLSQQLRAVKPNHPPLQLSPFEQRAQQCDLWLARKQYPQAVQWAQELRQQLTLHQQQWQQQAAVSRPRFDSVPTQYHPPSFAAHLMLQYALSSLGRGPNRLVGGDFEDLTQMRSNGWTDAHHSDSPLQTAVTLSSDAPRHGQTALRLSAQRSPSNGHQSLLATEEPPQLQISSPPLSLPAGTVVEITGWVRIGRPRLAKGTVITTTGSLQISDSLGGDQLALQIQQTAGWEPFRLVRAAVDQQPLQLTFVLTGEVTAEIDAVMVREIHRPQGVTISATTGS